jgi:hypothetical protein
MPKRPAKKPDYLTTMEVAAMFRIRYSRARDLMLTGKMGEPVTSPLSVRKTEAEKFYASLMQKKAKMIETRKEQLSSSRQKETK